MRKYRLGLHHVALLSVLTVAGTLSVFALTLPQAEDPATTAAGVVSSWNSAVGTIETEDADFRELLESYQRNPPGRVLLAPDLRASQKKRRLALCARIIASHEERIRALKELAKFENASQ